jgi:hypothetical protein
MRLEQIIATVARLAMAQVREICGVVSFASGMRLHLWQVRKPLGTLCYAGCMSGSSLLDDLPGGINARRCSSKRGKQLYQLRLATATCPAGIAAA